MDRTWIVHPKSAARAVCLAFAMLLVLPLVLPAALPAGSAAEADVDDDELGPGGEFNNGHGSARGTGVRVGPSRSGFNFTTDFAISLADFQNTVARGDSRGVSLGMILETVADAVDEDGEYLPENLRIDSRDEDAADGVRREEFGGGEGGFGGAVGSQYVRATEDPFAEVETIMGTLGIDAAVLFEGGTSRATAGVVDGNVREARGEAAFERIVLGGGALVLEGLEWTAVHRTGAEEEVDATFTLGSISAGGEELIGGEESEQGAEALSEAIDQANEVISELGLFIEAPEKAINEETGQVSMTPMKISVGPSEVSRGVAGPLSDFIQPGREALADLLIEADETFGAVFLLFDVAFGAFAGGGEILFEIGGARALTGFQEFDDPFGNGATGMGEEFGEIPDETTPEEQPQESEPPQTDSSAELDAPSPDTGDSTEAPAPETSDEPVEEPVEEPVASDPPQQGNQGQEELAAPAASPGPTGGQALTAALVALLVAAGLGAADFLRLRQSQRTIPI